MVVKSQKEKGKGSLEALKACDVRHQMFPLYACQYPSRFICRRLCQMEGRVSVIYSSVEVKEEENGTSEEVLFFLHSKRKNRVMPLEAILMVILWCTAWK